MNHPVTYVDTDQLRQTNIIVRFGVGYSIEIPVNTDDQPIIDLQGDYITTMYISFDRHCYGLSGNLLRVLLEYFNNDYNQLGAFLYDRREYLPYYLEKVYHCRVVDGTTCCHKCCGSAGHKLHEVSRANKLFASRLQKACRC